MGSWLRRLRPFVFLGLGLGLILFAGYRAADKPFGQPMPENGSKEVWGGATVGQTFVAPFDGLHRVDIYLSPGGHANTADMLFHLRTSQDAAEDLRSSVVNAATIKAEDWVQFEFAPVPDSGGKSYYFSLESPLATSGNALWVFRSWQDRYRDGVYYVDGAPTDSDLAFLSYSQPGLIAWLRGLGRLLALGKPSIWGDPLFYGVLFVCYVILLGAAVYIGTRKGEAEGTQDPTD